MSKPIKVVYDKQCPACDAYCQLADAYSDQEELVLIDARADTPLMREITRRDLDIDEGMVVEIDGALYYGADAINMLANLGYRNRLFKYANKILFAHPRLAKLFYPVLRSSRNLLLKVLGVGRINNLGRPNNDKF